MAGPISNRSKPKAASGFATRAKPPIIAAPWSTGRPPTGLKAQLDIDRDAAHATLKTMPFDFGFPLRPYQQRAIEEVEKALEADRRQMLLAMATGTGKTKLAIALLYRLLAAKRFRRICFVVDRNALGQQAEAEFRSTKVVSAKTFADIFGFKGLGDVAPESETKVHICTIQGLVKRVLFARRQRPKRRRSISTTSWSSTSVIAAICSTARCPMPNSTSAARTTTSPNIAGCWSISTRSRSASPRRRPCTPCISSASQSSPIPIARPSSTAILIDHEPPIQHRDRANPRRHHLPERRAGRDHRYATRARSTSRTRPTKSGSKSRLQPARHHPVPFNRVVAEELAKHIDPSLPGKTWSSPSTRRPCRHRRRTDQEGACEAAMARSRTRPSARSPAASIASATLIRSFRNDTLPKIAVTVDLLTTGIDVPSITNLVFLRRVNSRILYEQMLGRATRLCDEIGKETFRIFDAVDLYPHLRISPT